MAHIDDHDYFVGYTDTKPLLLSSDTRSKTEEEKYMHQFGGSLQFINE